MKEFTVVPIEKVNHDRRIVYPTHYSLALQARQSTKEQNLHNQESYESQTIVLLEHAQAMGWHGIGDDIIPFIENKRKDGKIVDASGAKRVDERPTMQDLWYHIEHDIVKAVMCRGVDRLFRHVAMVEPAHLLIYAENIAVLLSPSKRYDEEERALMCTTSTTTLKISVRF